MESLLPRIMQIAKRLKEAEAQRTELANQLRASSHSAIVPVVTEVPKALIVAAVDGGLLKKSFHGVDCVLARAVAVCFRCQDGKVDSVSYFPSKTPPAQPFVAESFSDMDWLTFASLQRQRVESSVAVGALEKFSDLQLLLLDGPIVPHATDRPGRGSPLQEDYEDLIRTHRRLFSTAREKGVRLAGIVEDSRNTAFCMWLSGQVPGWTELLQRTRDTNLLDLLLKRGERTPTLPYNKNTEEHPILRDLGDEIGSHLFSFYVKTAVADRPIRVDFFATDPEEAEQEADTLAALLLGVSGKHPTYGLPAPIIEADNAAKLPESEMETFYSYILTYAGRIGSILRLRREQRPF